MAEQTTHLSDVLLSEDELLDEVNAGIRLIRKKNGLTFGTDAYLLAAFVRPAPHSVAVDLGSGTGIISLLLLKTGKIRIAHAVEIQPAFAELIGRNASINGCADTLIPHRADVRELSPADVGEEVPLVVANPPYMTCGSGRRNESDEKYIARHEVCGNVADFCAAAERLLRYGGRFVCVWRPDRLSELLSALRDCRLEPKRMTFVHADAHTEPSSVLIEAVKGAAPSLRVTPPLLLYEDSTEVSSRREMTAEAKFIYQNCRFPSAEPDGRPE